MGDLSNSAAQLMFKTNRHNHSIAFEISSHLEFTPRVIEECRPYLVAYYTHSEMVEINVLLREMLMNAIVHGNQCKLEYYVKCSLEHLDNKRLKIVVEDQGHGFDHTKVDMELPKPSGPVKRSGYILIKALSERIDFKDRGKRVTVYFNAKEQNIL